MIDRRRLLVLTAAAGAPSSQAAVRQVAALPAGPVDPTAVLAETGAPAVAGLVSDADRVILEASGGLRRVGSPDRIGPREPWHIGSNTKAMTAALYARLVEAGQAKWGATLVELFPGVKIDPAWSSTTIEQVMSHRSGIADGSMMASGWLMRAHADRRPLPIQRAEVAARLLGSPPAGRPGSFEYANFNYILAGAAIETITGAAWEETIRARLFQPLGIESAGFGAPTGDAPWGHLPAPGGGLTPVDPSGPADNPPALGPAGTAHMTLADHARFARLFLKDN
ncbi:MAG: serine hydrolase domain-containing protein, partial [Caulobacter sp.]